MYVEILSSIGSRKKSEQKSQLNEFEVEVETRSTTAGKE